jgi:hypothetical protein
MAELTLGDQRSLGGCLVSETVVLTGGSFSLCGRGTAGARARRLGCLRAASPVRRGAAGTLRRRGAAHSLHERPH